MRKCQIWQYSHLKKQKHAKKYILNIKTKVLKKIMGYAIRGESIKNLNERTFPTFSKILTKQSVPDATLPRDEMPSITMCYCDSELEVTVDVKNSVAPAVLGRAVTCMAAETRSMSELEDSSRVRGRVEK